MAERLNEIVVTIRVDTTKRKTETTLKLLADESTADFRQRVSEALEASLDDYVEGGP